VDFYMIYVGAYDHGETLLEVLDGSMDLRETEVVTAETAADALMEYPEAATSCRPDSPFVDWAVDFSDGHEGYMAVSERLIATVMGFSLPKVKKEE